MTSPAAAGGSATDPFFARSRLAGAAFIAAFTYVFLANAWLGDDAYITFRVIWNTLNGYGLTFNPDERVQAYTHPLWMFVMMGAYAVTREFFFTAQVVCYAFALAAVLVVVRAAGQVAAGATALLWLASSKAFIDYTSSGLENPLSYLLLALFFTRFCSLPADVIKSRELRRFGLLASLAFVNRMDSVVLYALPIGWLALRAWRRPDERFRPLIIAFATFAGPILLWLAFATVYYGFPLPNTYYAKVATGVPAGLIYRQGFAYLLNSFGHDPITLGTIGIAVALAFRAALPVKLAATSCLLYVVYTVSVGGDFMSGRFFAMPFLVAVVLVFHTASASYRTAAAALVLYTVVMPLVPIKTTARYDAAWSWRSQNGIKDERGHYHRITNVFFYSPFRELPDHTWVREGRSFRESPDKVTIQGSIGFYGLMAGPHKHLIDRNALSDPLLARLPVSRQYYFEFYAGHFFRDIPDGYVQSLERGGNHLTEPYLHDYYDKLLDVIRGPLFTTSRLQNIWYLNIGEGRRFARRYEARRPIALSVRASNERFGTDVGEKEPVAGVIRSTGRAGYLQYGPGIPMKRGNYRARWLGTVDGSHTGRIGFVDVWAGEQRLARRDIGPQDVQPEKRQLVEVSFTLEDEVDQLEYRLWITGHPVVVLERVELFSGPPAAPTGG